MTEENLGKQNKIRHIWSILCERAIIDSESNSLTLSNVLEQVNIENKQEFEKAKKDQNIAISYPFELITLWDRDDKEESKTQAKVTIKDPSGKIIGEHEHEIVFPRDKKRLRFRVRFNALPPVTKPGEYSFLIYLKSEKTQKFEKKGFVPLTINLVDKN